MKKAYVKPVLIAEQYEMMAYCNPNCTYHTGEIGNAEMFMDFNTKICSGDQGHKISSGYIKNTEHELWKYATAGDGSESSTSTGAALFDISNTGCDFVWLKPSSGTDQIQVWDYMAPENDDGVLRLETDVSKRNNLFNWGGTVSAFMDFFGGCSATDKTHGINYKTLQLNS